MLARVPPETSLRFVHRQAFLAVGSVITVGTRMYADGRRYADGFSATPMDWMPTELRRRQPSAHMYADGVNSEPDGLDRRHYLRFLQCTRDP